MTSHGFIGGTRRSNEGEIAEAIYQAGEDVRAKKITIHFFEISDDPENPSINTLVEFDCHDLDGTANLKRVKEFKQALQKIPKVKWGDPLILGAKGYRKF